MDRLEHELAMELKKIYARFKANESLDDDELAYLISELEDLDGTLGCLGIEYRIVANAIRQEVMVLKDFRFFRERR